MLQLLLVLDVAVGRGDGGHRGPEPHPSSHTHPPASLTLTYAGARAHTHTHSRAHLHASPSHTQTCAHTHRDACACVYHHHTGTLTSLTRAHTRAHTPPCAGPHTHLWARPHTSTLTHGHGYSHVSHGHKWIHTRTHTEAHSQLGVLLSYTGPLLFVLRNGSHAGTLAPTEDLGSPEPQLPQHRGNPVVVQICVFPNTQSLSGPTHAAAHSLPHLRTHAHTHTTLKATAPPYTQAARPTPPHPSAEQARGTEAVSQGPLEPPPSPKRDPRRGRGALGGWRRRGERHRPVVYVAREWWECSRRRGIKTQR